MTIAGFTQFDNLELRGDPDLHVMEHLDRPARLFVAAWLDGVRLPAIVTSTVFYACGSVAFAITLQGCAPIGGRITTLPRILFGISACLLLFPTNWILDLAGVAAAFGAVLAISILPATSRQSS